VKTIKQVTLLLAGLALCAGCGGGSASPTDDAASGQCTTLGQVSFVRTTLQDIYFWYRELPDPNPAGFSSPEQYLEAVRYRTLDSSYSYITGRAASDAFFSESQFIGIGLSYERISETELRVAAAFPDSPAAEAGLARGDFLLVINGKAVADLLRTGEIGTIFGPGEMGVVVDLVWRSFPGGDQRQATLRKRAVTIPTVSETRLVDQDGRRVGYVHFRNFVSPSVAALNAAFGELRAQRADDLVLDLRYNGGGLVSVAQLLGGLIGGVRTSGQVFAEFFHNDKNTRRNSVLRFEAPAASLDLPRLVVITSGASASASEMVINALQPFIPVTVVGDTTFGKPVGQYGFNFCDKVLFPVSFEVRNARGRGDYYQGITADCPAPDDLDHALGDAAEASLAEALHFLRAGRCSTQAAGASRTLAERRTKAPPIPVSDWQRLLGAY
jgi:C-terminal processing protease CtpA/Prc